MRRILLLCLCLWTAAASGVDVAATTVVLVRHAEKAAAPTQNPPLSEAGQQRAQRLADALKSARIAAIVVTPYLRTQQTAAPLAQRNGLQAQVVDVAGDTATHARAVAAAVLAQAHAGGNTLVVGHSNTLPAIIEALGGPAVAPIGDDEFDRLYTLVLQPGAKPTLVESRY